MLGLNEETIPDLLNDVVSSKISSRSKLRAIRALYYLSFVPEHREMLFYSGATEILQQVLVTRELRN